MLLLTAETLKNALESMKTCLGKFYLLKGLDVTTNSPPRSRVGVRKSAEMGETTKKVSERTSLVIWSENKWKKRKKNEKNRKKWKKWKKSRQQKKTRAINNYDQACRKLVENVNKTVEFPHTCICWILRCMKVPGGPGRVHRVARRSLVGAQSC